jgi:hypothetical protein
MRNFCVCIFCAGFHLAPGAVESRIEPTVADMAAMQPSLVVGGHCTGDFGVGGGGRVAWPWQFMRVAWLWKVGQRAGHWSRNLSRL